MFPSAFTASCVDPKNFVSLVVTRRRSMLMKSKTNYRVFHQLADLGWVDFDLGRSAVCPIVLNKWSFSGIG